MGQNCGVREAGKRTGQGQSFAGEIKKSCLKTYQLIDNQCFVRGVRGSYLRVVNQFAGGCAAGEI